MRSVGDLLSTSSPRTSDRPWALSEVDKSLGMVDNGSKMGDPAARVVAMADACVICVEADHECLRYSERNAGSANRCVIGLGLLFAADTAEASGLGAGPERRYAKTFTNCRYGTAAHATVTS